MLGPPLLSDAQRVGLKFSLRTVDLFPLFRSNNFWFVYSVVLLSGDNFRTVSSSWWITLLILCEVSPSLIKFSLLWAILHWILTQPLLLPINFMRCVPFPFFYLLLSYPCHWIWIPCERRMAGPPFFIHSACLWIGIFRRFTMNINYWHITEVCILWSVFCCQVSPGIHSSVSNFLPSGVLPETCSGAHLSLFTASQTVSLCIVFVVSVLGIKIYIVILGKIVENIY